MEPKRNASIENSNTPRRKITELIELCFDHRIFATSFVRARAKLSHNGPSSSSLAALSIRISGTRSWSIRLNCAFVTGAMRVRTVQVSEVINLSSSTTTQAEVRAFQCRTSSFRLSSIWLTVCVTLRKYWGLVFFYLFRRRIRWLTECTFAYVHVYCQYCAVRVRCDVRSDWLWKFACS